MDRLLALGDTHGNTSAVVNVAIPQAKKNDCTTLVQCGDFGYWEHEREGERFLHKVSEHLVRNDMTMFWLDGNHDNHPLLWQNYAPEGPYGFCRIRQNLWYIPRGTVWQWGNVRYLAMGGAFSIDNQWRRRSELAQGMPGTLWWPTEMIRQEDIEVAIENLEGQPVDVMFSHDCPRGVDIPGIHSEDKWKFPETWKNRESLREVFDAAKPKLLVHGHYHVRYSQMLAEPKERAGELVYDPCRIEGLANDGLPGFGIILDIAALFPQDINFS